MPVTKTLLKEQAVVTDYDPIARHEAKKVFGDTVQFYSELEGLPPS